MAERGDLKRLAVVIPAYRAAATVTTVVSQARQAAPTAWICVVDDGSDDQTAATATAAGADVITFDHNRGKGAALAAGVDHAAAAGADVIVTLDADGQHQPAALTALAEPVLAGQADVVLGARERNAGMPTQRRLTNWLSAQLVSRAAGYPVPDAQTGYRAFSRGVAQAVRPAEQRYDYEIAFLLGAIRAGFRVRSIPVATIYDGARSHFRSIADTWRVARVFARHGGEILRGKR